MRYAIVAAVSVASGTLTTPSTAQPVDKPALAAGAPAPVDCELHVWPSSGLRSTYFGWFHGGIVDGAVQGRDGYRKLPETPLDPERQAEILKSLPLADLLKLPGYRAVIHKNAPDSRVVRRAQGRLTDEGTACYAELVVDDVFFQEDIVTGKYLKTLYRFRAFEGDAPARRFGAYSQVKLLHFPPTGPEDAEAALEELGKAYADAVGEFGKALNKPAGKKRGK
ncbi:hypothetical protein GCM10011349_04310 [Novosphingobium indicum]|uniref:Uncharacterized protein n=2 Tax=Novosphingobium indicum TaxID=462949 RepID=A0ABQ2JB96_9SPHN|nr:hypothetical protein GCM10011349_04310 [Novosphingobium indicum]